MDQWKTSSLQRCAPVPYKQLADYLQQFDYQHSLSLLVTLKNWYTLLLSFQHLFKPDATRGYHQHYRWNVFLYMSFKARPEVDVNQPTLNVTMRTILFVFTPPGSYKCPVDQL